MRVGFVVIRCIEKGRLFIHMTSYTLFAYLMDSLDSAFRALQGLDTWRPDGWGERFFTELSREHTEWADKRTSIYMTASELLYYFAIRGDNEELGMSFYEKPQRLLRMILMFFPHTLN